MCTDGIKKVAVVRNHQHGIIEIGEVIFQPVNRFQVEVVGWLVEQQIVGFSEQSLSQQYFYFLSS